MKHLLTDIVVATTFSVLYECLKTGKTITLKELTDQVNHREKKARVNELVIASLLNTIYTHPANEFVEKLQSHLKFTKAQLSALTVLCFECGQDVYPKWLVIGNKSDCANMMRDRNNTLVLLRAAHMTKNPPFEPGVKKDMSLADAVGGKRQETPVDSVIGGKPDVAKKLVSALELRTAPIGNRYYEAQTALGQIPPEIETMVAKQTVDMVSGTGNTEQRVYLDLPLHETTEEAFATMDSIYKSTPNSMLLGDYRNLTLELTKAAIFHQPVTFNHLRNAIDVSKGRLSDMLLNIVETLPDTMHSGLLRNLLSFIEKPNGDVPHWWTKANNGASDEEVHQMRKYVANGLSGQWTQLINAHNVRDKKANEQLAVKYQLVEQSVKMGLVSKLLAENASQFDIQNLMQFNKFGWEHTGNFVWTAFTPESIGQVEIFIWDTPIDDEVKAVVDNTPHGAALRNNAYIPYHHAESFNWYYRSFPVPHSIHIVPNTK